MEPRAYALVRDQSIAPVDAIKAVMAGATPHKLRPRTVLYPAALALTLGFAAVFLVVGCFLDAIPAINSKGPPMKGIRSMRTPKTARNGSSRARTLSA